MALQTEAVEAVDLQEAVLTNLLPVAVEAMDLWEPILVSPWS